MALGLSIDDIGNVVLNFRPPSALHQSDQFGLLNTSSVKDCDLGPIHSQSPTTRDYFGGDSKASTRPLNAPRGPSGPRRPRQLDEVSVRPPNAPRGPRRALDLNEIAAVRSPKKVAKFSQDGKLSKNRDVDRQHFLVMRARKVRVIFSALRAHAEACRDARHIFQKRCGVQCLSFALHSALRSTLLHKAWMPLQNAVDAHRARVATLLNSHRVRRMLVYFLTWHMDFRMVKYVRPSRVQQLRVATYFKAWQSWERIKWHCRRAAGCCVRQNQFATMRLAVCIWRGTVETEAVLQILHFARKPQILRALRHCFKCWHRRASVLHHQAQLSRGLRYRRLRSGFCHWFSKRDSILRIRGVLGSLVAVCVNVAQRGAFQSWQDALLDDSQQRIHLQRSLREHADMIKLIGKVRRKCSEMEAELGIDAQRLQTAQRRKPELQEEVTKLQRQLHHEEELHLASERNVETRRRQAEEVRAKVDSLLKELEDNQSVASPIHRSSSPSFSINSRQRTISQ